MIYNPAYTYQIPTKNHQSLEVYEKPIDIWRHVPKDLRNSNLTINIAFADFDLDRCGLLTLLFYPIEP